MRENNNNPERLADIITAAQNIDSLISGHTCESFVEDKKCYYEVLKYTAKIGEASYMLTSDFLDSHPLIPWDRVSNMRYFRIEAEKPGIPHIIWDIATKDIPWLVFIIERMII